MTDCNDSERSVPIRAPILTDVSFQLADQISPVLQRLRSSGQTQIRPFAPGILAAAYGFAGYLIAKFFEAFAEEIGKRAAGGLLKASVHAQPEDRTSEVVKRLDAIQAELRELRVDHTDPLTLQRALDASLSRLAAALEDSGLSGEDAQSLTRKVEATIVAEISL
jgi:hypothetical protein